MKMRHEYYKRHAFVAGGILSIVLALQKLEILDTRTTTWVALPVMVYFSISIVMAYHTFVENKRIQKIAAKEGAKVVKKADKAKTKAAKKKAKSVKKLAKGKSD